MFKRLEFTPLTGFASAHLQMVVATFFPPGNPPPTQSLIVTLEDGDRLCCEVSTPLEWQPDQRSIVMVHGLGGSHQSNYMIRLARKFYQLGDRVIRINLRGCGSGQGLNRCTYHSGQSQDIKEVLETIKKATPHSPINLIGFSLGGNIILKLAGELGAEAKRLVERLVAICPPIDVNKSIRQLSHKSNWIYHKYYLKQIHFQGRHWIKEQRFSTIKEFDEKITAALWGYRNVEDYYDKCSSIKFIPNIQVPCELLFAEDDPFVDYRDIKNVVIPQAMHLFLTSKGSHLGFIGRESNERGVYWMDHFVLQTLDKKSSNTLSK